MAHLGRNGPASGLAEEADDQQLDRLLALADPIRNVRLATITRGLHADLRAAIAVRLEGGSRRPRLGKGTVIALVAATILVGAIGGTAAALGTHTGFFPKAGGEMDSSEMLDQSAPDILTVIDADTLKYPLPQGGTWDHFKQTYPHATHGYVQATGLEARVAFESSCQWQESWLSGSQAHDSAQMAAALAVLTRVPDWPIVRKVDGGGIVAGFRTISEVARAQNTKEFSRLHDLNCRGGHSPL